MYLKKFEKLEKAGRPIRVGLVGLGAMGKGMAYNIHHTPGMQLVYVGDTDPKRYEELREIMAELGFRTINEMVGQADILRVREDLDFWKLKTLDLKPIITKIDAPENVGLYKQMEQDHELDRILDLKLIEVSKPALDNADPVSAEFDIRNTDRAVGAMLSNEISKKFGSVGLPEGTINIKLRGSAGQSFGAFSTKGIRFELEGEANDYFGKGLSGAQLIIHPDRDAKFEAKKNIIINIKIQMVM